jgi:hypothetical protein
MQTVYHKLTGVAFVRDPVDCREMLASGMYVTEQPSEEEMLAAQDASVNLESSETSGAGSPWAPAVVKPPKKTHKVAV